MVSVFGRPRPGRPREEDNSGYSERATGSGSAKYRSLIFNALTGVTEGYSKTLELMGVGYRVQQAGEGIILSVGYSHPVEIRPIEGVTLEVEGNNRVHVRGIDKQKVGALAAQVRRVRPPNAYKEKGIRYQGEILHFKPGKAAARKA